MGINQLRHSGQRVVITGMGVVSPLGQTLVEFKDALYEGRSGITHWQQCDERNYSKIGGDMSAFSLQTFLERPEHGFAFPAAKTVSRTLRNTPRSGTLTASAALAAFQDANLHENKIPAARIGHILAGHNINNDFIYRNSLAYEQEPEYIDPLYGMLFLDSDVLAVIAQLLDLRGVCFTVGGACASGNLALLTALDLLRVGRADAIVVSGAGVILDPVVRQGWSIIDAISTKSFNDTPHLASRPFDARREGFVPSEGAAVVVLETLASAQTRGVPIYAELLGAASTSNASRLPKPELDAQMRVMQHALEDAGVAPKQIDYVNAHATSTPLGDAIEVQAIKNVFGEHAYHMPINSTKSMVGHCLAAAAIVELVATVLQMQYNFVHPTINLTNPDPELDLDFVPTLARAHVTNLAVSNAFGFGGLNACVVVGRYYNNED